MTKLILIFVFLLLFVSNGLCQNNANSSNTKSGQIIDETSNTKTEKTNTEQVNSNPNQDYINYLKEINEQSQKKIDSQISNFSWMISIIGFLFAFITICLLFTSYFGLKEYRKVRNQRKKVDKIVKEIVKEKEKELKNSVKVKNQIYYTNADVLFRLEKYKEANQTMEEINLDGESADFLYNYRLFDGKIKFYIREYPRSKTIFEELLETKELKSNIPELVKVYDLIGANNMRIYESQEDTQKDKKLIEAAIDNFKKAEKKSNDNFDKKRILSNIQSAYNMLGDYDEALNFYEKATSIVDINSKGKKDIERLEFGILLPAIHSYWKKSKVTEIYPILENIMENFFPNDETGMEKFLREKFKDEPTEIEDILNKYKRLKLEAERSLDVEVKE